MTFSLYRALLLVLGATSSLASILPRQNVECNEVNGGLGNFVVYNAAISETVGCLDENARWVVDGSCGVFNATAGYTGPGKFLRYESCDVGYMRPALSPTMWEREIRGEEREGTVVSC